MIISCGMAVKRTAMLGVSERKMKALTVKMEMTAMIGKSTYNDKFCVLSV